ncbi:DNA-3-methyladenine glycosylase family protein [Sphingopyxis yananensis]|uniref:DNA-3-methyladenine glycosylase family protein n=1 Tax=Sphingopyxis yananensis TaxID=2886687 RepID=UPI001D116D37|nr:DNA-3-methyladenine glycosylase 2 family protein [Sphingopyxis yananensis]MCC2603432.1 DNA-3-methyladenine glycosylase 2 family protein [Sphingopyxis yananensis]
MSLTSDDITQALNSLSEHDERLATALASAGYPEPRIQKPGYRTMMKTIVGQQVSIAAANSIWNKLEAHVGPDCDPAVILASDAAQLRACGLSAQKQSYAHSLAELVINGIIDFANLPADDEEAIALLTQIRGIGRWSAEIYLMFAEGRPNIWPAGDLAVQESVGRIFALPERPKEKLTRSLGEQWRPHRSSAALFCWHYRHVTPL